MKQARNSIHNTQGVTMKKSILIMSLAVALVLAFAATASATSAKTWNYNQDYYSWGSYSGAGITVPTNGLTLGAGGSTVSGNTNPTAPGGVHSHYQTTTAKCGICHSVHRAKAGGVKLLNTDTATCAGCHILGTSTVTNAVVAWGTAAAPRRGPHSSAGTSGSCSDRACHSASPHGVGGSQYGLFSAKLLNGGVDAAVAVAAGAPAQSGVTAALLTGAGANTNFTGAADAIRVGYTCNQADCHVQTMLSVVQAGWSESREINYGEDLITPGGAANNYKLKTGHISVQGIGTTAFAAAASCASCHDQVAAGTRSGYAFPHAQSVAGAASTTQNFLWYNMGNGAGNATTPIVNANQKSFDGACLKCHTNGALSSGVGITY